jgi:hypothetical protein
MYCSLSIESHQMTFRYLKKASGGEKEEVRKLRFVGHKDILKFS